MQNISRLVPYIIAMVVIVVAANILVQTQVQYFGLQEVLTWGALTYPFAFLVNDLTNRHLGSAAARKVVLIGFVIAVILSIWLATPRIAIASGTAFLVAHFLDISIFDKLRNNAWWVPPFISTFIGSVVDTVIFFSMAFAPTFAGIDAAFGFDDNSLGFPASAFGIEMPLWASLAVGDMIVKICVGLFALIPYGGFLKVTETKAA
ncbi:MAG: queuosine precursor transporter [Rhizobiaceae bacterium]|nr:queuosine precursor transporter [Rhizobiaceae bacterium]